MVMEFDQYSILTGPRRPESWSWLPAAGPAMVQVFRSASGREVSSSSGPNGTSRDSGSGAISAVSWAEAGRKGIRKKRADRKNGAARRNESRLENIILTGLKETTMKDSKK